MGQTVTLTTQPSRESDLFCSSFFDAKQYCCFKALAYYTKPENGGIPEETIRDDFYRYSTEIAESFAKSHMDAWQHYKQFGGYELINPSNDFDACRYLDAKARALNALDTENGTWDRERLAAVLREQKVTPLEHFIRFAGKGPGEVEQGLTAQGTIPACFAVPEDRRVPSALELSRKSPLFAASFVDRKQYLCFKALAFYAKRENGGIPEETIRKDLPHYASQIGVFLESANLDAWQHYKRFGGYELVNPSNDFDARRYLEAKVAAINDAGLMQEDGPWNLDRLLDFLREYQLTPLEHFIRHAGTGPGEVAEGLTDDGKIPARFAVPEDERVPLLSDADISPPRPAKGLPKPERRNPRDYFSVGCYLQFKAIHDFQRKDRGGLSQEQIRKNILLYAAEILRIFKKGHVDPWIHYREYGTLEGINPSNQFDTVSYLAAKARAMNEQGLLHNGQPWDALDVARMLKSEHMSALEHFLLYAGTGEGEVPNGLTDEGEIPEEYAVPDVLHVEPLDVADFERTIAQPPQVIDDKPPIPVQKQEIDRLPEYAVPARVERQWVRFGRELKKSPAGRIIFATVILPGILIFFYLLLFASQAYISETRFAVRGQTGTPNLEGLGALFNLSQGSLSDSYIVADYILSPDMFEKLDEKLGLREHYSDRQWDIWYRLSQNASKDDIVDFWQWACEASFDPDTGILAVQVKAFTPEMALSVCKGILSESEALVNAMNARARRDAMSQAEVEVSRAEERIRKARDALHAYRQSTAVLDPSAVTTGLYTLVNNLEAEVTKTASELSEALTFMNKESPRVRQLKNRLKVLERKLADEKKRLAGSLKDGQSVNDMLAGFQKLTLEEEFAQKQLTSAMTSLEAARVRADAQTQYVEAFQQPALADESLYPRPLLFSCIYMITSLLLLGLVSLVIAAVREHAGF